MHSLCINGTALSLDNIYAVSYGKMQVMVAEELKVNVNAAVNYIQQAVNDRAVIYGVTTNFGGMAQEAIDPIYASHLQENLLWGLKCGVGNKLPIPYVRAGMLIAANALLKGLSGVRFELIERIILFLNAHLTPIIYDCGSIGASGDLIPMSYVVSCIIGLDETYKVVTPSQQEISAVEALAQLNLDPLRLNPKEGLAVINSTAMTTGIAVHCTKECDFLFHLSCSINAFFMLATEANQQSLDPFVHAHKAHPGQIAVAAKMRSLLLGAKFTLKESIVPKDLVQDRYSLRCLAQYLGVIADGLSVISRQVCTEANSVTDNPLIDVANAKVLHSGNFLAEYIGVSMDQLRYYLSLLIKHMDVQIALIVAPEFNKGLPGSLAVDNGGPVKFGLKGLQICANSLMPMILHKSNSIAPLYPTHAEQFNQNINSQGYASAVLSSQSLELARWYCAIALIFAIQSIELRCYQQYGTYDVCAFLSEPLIKLYKAVYRSINKTINIVSPLIVHNHEQALDKYIKDIYDDLTCSEGTIASALRQVEQSSCV